MVTVYILCFISYERSNAQPIDPAPQQPRAFDEQTWQHLHQELEYNEAPRVARERSEERDELPPDPDRFERLLQRLSPFLYAALALIVGILLYAIYRTQSGQFSRKLAKPPVADELPDLSADPAQTDFDHYIGQAESRGDFSLAIRLHFLALLGALQRAGQLQWQRDKTNRAYVRELEGRPYQAEFAGLTQVFERSWYGAYRPDAAAYEPVRDQFLSLRQRHGAAWAPDLVTPESEAHAE